MIDETKVERVDSGKYGKHKYIRESDYLAMVRERDVLAKQIHKYMHIQCSPDECMTSGEGCDGGIHHPNYQTPKPYWEREL